MSLYGGASDFINVYWDSAGTVLMGYNMNGTVASGTWNASGLIVAGTRYTLQVAYTGGGSMIFSVDGTARITLSGIPAAFGIAPNNVYYGSNSAGRNQGDAAIDLNTTAVELLSLGALAARCGVDSWTASG
jgi:hypothetical protein